MSEIADLTLTTNHYLLVIQTFFHTGGEVSFLLHQQCLFYEDLLKLTPKNTHSQWEQANPKHFCFIVFMLFLADISKNQLCNTCVKWLQLFLASALDPPVFNDAGSVLFILQTWTSDLFPFQNKLGRTLHHVEPFYESTPVRIWDHKIRGHSYVWPAHVRLVCAFQMRKLCIWKAFISFYIYIYI